MRHLPISRSAGKLLPGWARGLGFIVLLSLLLMEAAMAQAVLRVTAPLQDSSTTSASGPNGTVAHAYVRAHWIITASELASLPLNTALSSLGFDYSAATNSAAGGTIKFYLQNTSDAVNNKGGTWATAISGMTLVYDGAFNLPVAPGALVADVALSGSFTYTGGGLYVAYEYIGQQFSSAVAVYRANSQGVSQGIYRGASSVSLPDPLGGPTSFRPTMRLGFPNPVANDLSLQDLSPQFGYFSSLWDQNLLAIQVQNTGRQDHPSSTVALQISGANAFSGNVPVPALTAGDTTTLNPAAATYLPGLQTISATLPADDRAANNQLSVDQQVSCNRLSYAGLQPSGNPIGFNGGAGIMAAKYQAPTVPVQLNSVHVGIGSDANTPGKTVRAVVLDQSGVIQASSDPMVIEAGQQGQTVEMALATPLRLAPGAVFYAGLLQTAASPGYFPLGTETAIHLEAGRYYTFASTGGVPTESPTNLGRFRIGVGLSAVTDFTRATSGPIASGNTETFNATAGFSEYRFLVNGALMQQGTSGSFTYSPQYGDAVTLEALKNGCAANGVSSFTMDVNAIPLTVTANNATKVYGETLSFSGTEFTAAGLVAGETIGTASIASAGAASGAGVNGSPYPITISGASGGTFNPARYVASYMPGALTVQPASTTLTLAPPGAATVGKPLALSAHLSVIAPGAGTPSGQVVFSAGAQECSAEVTNLAASCSLTPAGAGSMDITAHYLGDGNFSESSVQTSVAVAAATPTPVPTLGQWTLALMSATLAGLALAARRKTLIS